MRTLAWELKRLCEQNRDNSHGTRVMRERYLSLCAEQLWQSGFKDLHVDGLKGRHVHRLLNLWHAQGLSIGTIKNRMAALRWWANKIGHGHMIPPLNKTLQIPHRVGVSRVSKAISVSPEQWLKIRDRHVRMSIRLQQVFGLRREESIKFQPAFADRGTTIVLKKSWCKGGRARTIPITTEEQRAVLTQAHALAGKGALIPGKRNYVKQLRVYEYELRRVGIYKAHGLRHGYAQARYEALSGMQAPVNSGLSSVTRDEYAADHQARLQVSSELGHARKQITSAYLGAVKAAKKK